MVVGKIVKKVDSSNSFVLVVHGAVAGKQHHGMVVVADQAVTAITMGQEDIIDLVHKSVLCHFYY